MRKIKILVVMGIGMVCFCQNGNAIIFPENRSFPIISATKLVFTVSSDDTTNIDEIVAPFEQEITKERLIEVFQGKKDSRNVELPNYPMYIFLKEDWHILPERKWIFFKSDGSLAGEFATVIYSGYPSEYRYKIPVYDIKSQSGITETSLTREELKKIGGQLTKIKLDGKWQYVVIVDIRNVFPYGFLGAGGWFVHYIDSSNTERVMKYDEFEKIWDKTFYGPFASK